MSLIECPIVAIVVFKDGNSVPFRGDRYEKENKNWMVYNLLKMLKKQLPNIKSVRMYDNTIKGGEKIILEYHPEISEIPKINMLFKYIRGENEQSLF